MSADAAAEKRRLPVAKLSVVAVVLVGGAAALLFGVDIRGAIDEGMDVVRHAGPVAFFTAMALLPAVAVPGSVFTLTAGPVFGERLGMPAVLALSLAAFTVNLVLTYALARRALRPFLVKWIVRLGYKVPDVDAGDLTDLTIVLRVTPGIPFFVQNYLLGIAGVPLGRYLLISCLAVWLYTTGFVLFGDALLNGEGRMAMVAVSVLVVAAVGAHWARKHYGKKKELVK
jgi:uncharacterized membrane protein YdjX (TVP38/TMEM64 family)